MKTIFVVLPTMKMFAGVFQLNSFNSLGGSGLIFILTSGESLSLALTELEGAMASTGMNSEIVDISPQVVLVRSNASENHWEEIAERTGHVIGIYRELFPSQLLTKKIERIIEERDDVHFDDILEILSTNSRFFCEWLASKSSLGLKSIRVQGAFQKVSGTTIKKAIGKLITDGGGKLDLDLPQKVVTVIISRNIFIGEQIALADRESMRKRRNQFRPFSLPITLSPNLSRVLMNMARVEKNQCILDPFCGTGGILLESAMIGARIYGSDIDIRMVEGTKENFAFFNLGYQHIEACDIEKAVDIFPVMDAVITDPPYGRSTSTGGEKMENLYSRMFVSAEKILKNGGRCAMILPSMTYLSNLSEGLFLENAVSHRVHRSLIRHFISLKKKA